jgi:hypothetical protein
MEITYGGKASFFLKGETSVVIDGSDASIKLYTTRQRSQKLKANGPGEYEIGGVLVTTLDVGGSYAHAITLDEINVLHLSGDPSKLSTRDIESLGRIDILIVRADDARAAQSAIGDITPRVVIPFGNNAAEVASASGVKDAEPQNRFAWNGVVTPPKAVLLKEPAGKKKAA